MEKRDWRLIVIFMWIGILIGILIVWALYSNFFDRLPYSLTFKIHGYTKENALAICSGKNLERTCYCLNSFISGIYKYTPTKDSIDLSFEELIERGGDCKNYADLSAELLNKLGFKTERVIIFVGETEKYSFSHVFLIVYNREGYCKLDAKDINCFRYIN